MESIYVPAYMAKHDANNKNREEGMDHPINSLQQKDYNDNQSTRTCDDQRNIKRHELQKTILKLQEEIKTLKAKHATEKETLQTEVSDLKEKVKEANHRCFQVTDSFISKLQDEKQNRVNIETQLRELQEQMMATVKVEPKKEVDDKTTPLSTSSNVGNEMTSRHSQNRGIQTPSSMTFQDEIEFEI